MISNNNVKMTAEKANKLAQTALRDREFFEQEHAYDNSKSTATRPWVGVAWHFPESKMWLWPDSKKIAFSNAIKVQFNMDNKTVRLVERQIRRAERKDDLKVAFAVILVMALCGSATYGIFKELRKTPKAKAGESLHGPKQALQDYDTIKLQMQKHQDTIVRGCH